MISSISITQIKYVLALEKTGSFSEAADMCYVTQSTLSTMIKKLEQQFNRQLFNRKSKPISLTQEGKLLITQLKVIYNEFENLQELVQESDQQFNGTLKIGIIPTLAPFLFPLFINKLVTGYPNIQFTINEITTEDIVTRLKNRDLDIGILSLPLKDKDLVEKCLFEEDFLVYDASGKNRKIKKYKIDDIDVNRLWLLEESHCLTSQIEKICHLKKIKKPNHNLDFKSGSILSLIELVNMNKGITLLPRLASLHKNLINQDFLYKIENPIPVREIGVITHPNFTKRRLLHILEKEIKEAVKPILKKARKVQVIKPY